MSVIAANREAAVVKTACIKIYIMIAYAEVMTATSKDYKGVTELLSSQNLPVEDIEKKLFHFFVVKEGGAIAGAIGLEIYGRYGLLRSLATDPAHRNKGIASALVHELIKYAKQVGLEEVYLLTETAEIYFEKKGFVKISREQVVEPVKQSKEFSHVCPASAVVMKKEIL